MLAHKRFRRAALLGAVLFSLFSNTHAGDPVAEVLAADEARGSALVAADINALDAILADDLRYTHSNGHLETKAIHIGTFGNGLRYEFFRTSNLHGHAITPDVVVLTGTIDQKKGKDGTWRELRLLFQGVWRKNGAVWQLASLQTALPPAPAK